ncbi:MAG TPA: hypothetical protein ENI92_00705 [Bacteroidetes bacterium]|nr:hypothetical protein [Bacteroidota bacterium]
MGQTMSEHHALHLSVLAAHYSLIFMAVAYTLRLRWILSFKAGVERQAATGTPGRTNPKKGYVYSLMNIAMPWAMESTRRKPLMYISFVIFHLGVLAAITQTFTLPFAPSLHTDPVGGNVFQVLIGAAFLVGVARIIRRVGSKYIRAISSPDDHFSLWVLTVWFFFGTLAAKYPLDSAALFGIDGNTAMLLFFSMTAFFLVYVPFSKISHYLYYPFTRYYFGRSMGHRGVYPLERKS